MDSIAASSNSDRMPLAFETLSSSAGTSSDALVASVWVASGSSNGDSATICATFPGTVATCNAS